MVKRASHEYIFKILEGGPLDDFFPQSNFLYLRFFWGVREGVKNASIQEVEWILSNNVISCNLDTAKQSTGTDWLVLGFRSKANSFAKNQRVNYLEKLFAFSFDVIAFL